MKQKIFISSCIFLSLVPILSITASADSSWVWLTRDPRPMLPWAVIGTLVVEIFVICFFNHIRDKNLIKSAAFIILGNLVSFLVPYIFVGITPNAFAFWGAGNFFDKIDFVANEGPFYIVGVAFLVLTLIIEIPIEYFGIRRCVKSKKRLLVTIIAANVITTAAIAIIERTVYKGNW